MKFLYYAVLIVIVAALRLRLRRRAKSRGAQGANAEPRRTLYEMPFVRGGVSIVAAREVRERLRGRMFRFGTMLILLVVAAAILIPNLHHARTSSLRVGIVGVVSPALRAEVASVAHLGGDVAHITLEPSRSVAIAQVHRGQLDVAILNDTSLVVTTFATSPHAAEIAQIAHDLGVQRALATAKLNPGQLSILNHSLSLTITSLQPVALKASNVGTSVIGLILIFMMLQQYNTWTLIGVMEEKSSRVIEVLLSTIRPMQLLAGKVLGIGLVALAQATLIVGFALVLAKSVGSSMLHGAAPLELVSILVWLLLGYAFYSWVYAAAGSMTERQDQIQALALPLSVPLIVGYVTALTAAESGHASLLIRLFAYFPPTAPFAMPVLVGLSAVTWWAFALSVVVSLVATVGVARFAARVYQRAILRTGGRVPLRDALAWRRSARAPRT